MILANEFPKQLRIVLLLTELRPGGMERLVVHLADGLARRGIAVEVICLQDPGLLASLLTEKGVPVIALTSHGGKDIVALWRLRKEHRRFRPTIVHLHDYASLPYASLANMLAGRNPMLFTAHGLLYEGFDRLQKRLRFFSRCVTAISAVSDKVGRRHQQYLAWKHPIRIIANGVPAASVDDAARQRIRAELGCTGDTHLFLAVGNPRPEKGFEDLLDAAALLRGRNSGFLIAIAGNLTDSRYCRDLLAKLNRLRLDDCCRFLGFRQDTAALYSAADSFVLSSRSEGLPMVILEAMMVGLPVIATRIGGVPDAVGEHALLVDAQNPGQLAEAMRRMQSDVGLRSSLAESGKNHVGHHYGIERMVDQYLDWYKQVFEHL